MLVPVGAALRALARTIEFGTVTAAFAIAITTGPIEFRTVVARAIELGSIELGPLAERTIAGRAIVARARETRTVIAATLPIVALLPGLVFAAVAAAEILARTLAEVLARRTIATRTRVALLPRL
ncbi:hypothetical protein ACVWZR_004996 [Bradyrhizobium sp. i1.3.1]